MKDKGGVSLDDLALAKKYAQARADHHGTAQSVWEDKRYGDYVVIRSTDNIDKAYYQRVTTAQPKAGNPCHCAHICERRAAARLANPG